MNRHHMRMHDGRRRLRLASKPPSGRPARRQMRSQHLHRDIPLQLLLKTFEHNPHAAATDDLDDFVLAQPTEHRRIVTWFKAVHREVGGIGFIRLVHRSAEP